MFSEHPIRVFCVDDSPDLTTVLRMIIESGDEEGGLEWVGCLGSADHLVEEIARLNPLPDVVLLDGHMPGKAPLTAMRELAQAFPQVRTIIFSARNDVKFIDEAMDAGAAGFVWKLEATEKLIGVVRETAAAASK